MNIFDSKPWLKSYPSEVQKNITLDPNKTLLDFFEENFTKYATLPMIENQGTILTYQEVDTLSKNFASYIQNYTALQPGDHVAIQLPNILQYPIALIGFLRAGMVIVNMNPLYTPYEMENQIKDSEAKAIIILENFADKLEKILPNVNLETIIIAKIGDLLGLIKGGATNFIIKYCKKLIPKYSLPNAIKFSTSLSLGRNKNFTKYEAKGTDIAFIQYTGGTTGMPKGAMLSHQNILSNVIQSKTWVYTLKPYKEIIITAIPLYHIFALTANFLLMIAFGSLNVLITNPRDITKLIKKISRYKFTTLYAVAPLFKALCNDVNFKNLNFSQLKLAISGALSTPKTLSENWKKITKTPILEGYGLTEASPIISINPLNKTHKLESIGLPIPNTEIKIVDDNNIPVAYNTPGVLWVKGAQVMQGYWKNQKETDLVLQDSWLNTGDIASMDEDGFIKILDRKKDMINVSGFNVYPSEIENTLLLNEKIKEVAAIGVPYNEFREAIKLFIVKNDESLTKEEVLSHCKKHLAAYKVPKYIEFRLELPKSNIGKILKRQLIDEERKKTTP